MYTYVVATYILDYVEVHKHTIRGDTKDCQFELQIKKEKKKKMRKEDSLNIEEREREKEIYTEIQKYIYNRREKRRI